MKYVVIFWLPDNKKWIPLTSSEGSSINEAHRKLEHISIPNIQYGTYLHWKVVEADTVLTSLPPP